MKYYLIFIAVIIVILGVAAVAFIGEKSFPNILTPQAKISGVLFLNGVDPSNSTITLSERQIQGAQTSFQPFATSLPANNGTVWNFTKAIPGKSYEIQATLIQNGKIIMQSSPIEISAPSSHGKLELSVSQANPTQTATISGLVDLNGYIPTGATITVQGRKTGTTTVSTIASGLPAKDNLFISYTTALAGQTYDVIGYLYDNNGVKIGTSDITQYTAPATDEVLRINSVAQPPITQQPTQTPLSQATPPPTSTPQNSVISGTIAYNGQTPVNSRIVVFERPSGTSQFILATDNIAPTDGTAWSWNGGTAGSMYDLIAILKQKQSNGTDMDISTSNTVTVSAPAANEVFTINSGFSLPQVNGTITQQCGNYVNGADTFNATISFQSVQNAASYWIEMGLTNGGIELQSFTANSTSNPTQTYQQTVKNGVTTYVRYAYATVPNLRANSSQFSPFSNTVSFTCNR